MLKRCIICFLLILALISGTVCATGYTESPYAIKVNRAQNTVTVYKQDTSGAYTVPFKAMICSTGRTGFETPLGIYRLMGYRSEWRLMLDGTYGQYATCFQGNFLFHSICYEDDAHDTMVCEAYNSLGQAASMGCVRLETGDAKWIFDHCPAGTSVTIYDDADDPGPLGKPDRTVQSITAEMYNGWDPTDPAVGNPWNLSEITSLEFSEQTAQLTAGDSVTMQVLMQPDDAMLFWKSSDERIAQVNRQGKITGLSEGSAVITVYGINGTCTTCTLDVTGELLPFDDLVPGAWYYPEIRKALDKKLFTGITTTQFCPDAPVTRAMVLQLLYTLDRNSIGSGPDKSESDIWYHAAVDWALKKGLLSASENEAQYLHASLSRSELSNLIWLYMEKPLIESHRNETSNGRNNDAQMQRALDWMVENGLLHGSGDGLLPDRTATRAEAAAILVRAIESEIIHTPSSPLT